MDTPGRAIIIVFGDEEYILERLTSSGPLTGQIYTPQWVALFEKEAIEL